MSAGVGDCASLFAGVLSGGDLAAICRAPSRERSHPVRELLQQSPSGGPRLFDTTQALRAVLAKNPRWLRQQRSRLSNVKDYAEPASALAEVRAYGYLLQAGFGVTPIPRGQRATPDFVASTPGGDRIEVEVYTRQLEEGEARGLADFHAKPPPQQIPTSGVLLREHSTAPFGRPHAGETMTEQGISKLAQIKADASQFSGTVPGVLWVDGQDEELCLFPWREAAAPLTADYAGFHSGELWYACYGKKGLPIFERFWPAALGPEGAFNAGYVKMRHDGRFAAPSRLSCLVVAAQACTLAMENPNADQKLPEHFWEVFARVRHFDLT